MTTCRECGKQVSTEAQACPHCGVGSPGTVGKAVVIEATGKNFKAAQVLGAAFLVFAFAALLAGAGVLITTMLFLVGLAAYGYGRVGAWWHHR